MKSLYKIVLKNGTVRGYEADALSISGNWLYVIDVPESAEEKLNGAGHKAGFVVDMVLFWERVEEEEPRSLEDILESIKQFRKRVQHENAANGY